MTEKIDLFKLHKAEYASPKKPAIVSAGKGKYLSVAGKGGPGGEEFQSKVGSLYAAAYTLKFASKEKGKDFAVCKLEGVFSGGAALADLPPEAWEWRLMIRMPDFIKPADLRVATEKLREKGKCPDVEELEFVDLAEGKCVQMLHVGPYTEEAETIQQMLAFAADEGLAPRGDHHEIYLSDPRRVEPARLKTILRQPVG